MNTPDTSARTLRALEAAVAAVYFNDSADYLRALWTVVRELSPLTAAELERNPRQAYHDVGTGAADLAPEAPTILPVMGTEARLCQDIAARQRKGIAKYGTTVADNPLSLRQWLQHAYEECLDQSVYLRRAIEELDKEAGQRSS